MATDLHWTPEQDRILLNNGKVSLERIADLVSEAGPSRSVDACRDRRRILGLSNANSGWTDVRIAELSRLWREGHSASVVAAQMGVTRNSVIGKLNRIGCLRKGVDLAPQRVKRLNIVTNLKVQKPPPERRTGVGRSDGSFIALQSGLWLSSGLKARVSAVTEIEPDAFDLMTAKPWEEREKNECKWPFGPPDKTLSCCRPVARQGYCAKHADMAFQSRTPAQKQADKKLFAYIQKRVA